MKIVIEGKMKSSNHRLNEIPVKIERKNSLIKRIKRLINKGK
jgi:hypothetical protein